MKKYKVKITRENFKDFSDYYNADKKHVEDAIDQLYDKISAPRNSEMLDTAKAMFNRDFMNRDEWKNTFSLEDELNQKLQFLINYCADNDVAWNLEQEAGDFVYLKFSGNGLFWDKRFCTFIELPDYDALSLGEIRATLGTGSSETLPAEISSLSVNSINEEKNKILSAEEQLKKQKDDISFARTEELQKLEQEIKKMQNALYERKQELMAELNAKMAEMNEKKAELNKQIFMLESEIYSIRSYTGETIELRKVRDGKKASAETPLVVNQKIIYLDEDLARIVSIYQSEIASHFESFEAALKGSDEVFDNFCPQERCLTFFRLSKNATYRWFNGDKKMYMTEELIHGKKMGCILRNGEEAYLCWLDESWRVNEQGEPVPVTFSEDLMYRPDKETSYADVDDYSHMHSDSQNTMLSRVFAMFVVQGILDNKGLLEFPEAVKITKPGPYIVYNFATGWVTDDRFGDFATLVDNLNKRTKVKDQILVCYSKHFCQGRGEADRAHDCEVPEGINRVNYLESDDYGHSTIYVSAKKNTVTRVPQQM